MLVFRKNATGFTIIEVVLVLAIAGLIFVVVFLALPQVQRARRDVQRKGDLAAFIASLTTYEANNSGKLPNRNNIDDFADAYYNEKMDPTTGELYDVVYLSVSASNRLPAVGEIFVDTSNARCIHGSDTVTTGEVRFEGSPFAYANPDSPTDVSNKTHAAAIGLEVGYYCLDNLSSER